MAVLVCNFCGERLYYHGEPEGKYPVEHYFCTLDKWRELENENADLLEHWKDFIESWRCWRCGSFSFFSDVTRLSGVYTTKEEFSSEPMKEPFEFGPFWDDFLWFEITEVDTPASEVIKKYPQTRWLAKNDYEMRLYEDEERTKCIAQFRRIEIVDPVTVATMSLAAFKKMLASWDDVEFFYHKVYYNFMRENGAINIYRGHGYQQIVWHADKIDVEEIINATFLDDGKSIAEAQAEVEL